MLYFFESVLTIEIANVHRIFYFSKQDEKKTETQRTQRITERMRLFNMHPKKSLYR